MMVATTTSAAAPKTPPATATAVWKPVRNAPLATISPRTATPTTLPVWRAALMTPPAMPTCSGGAEATAAEVAAGIAKAIPNPAVKVNTATTT